MPLAARLSLLLRGYTLGSFNELFQCLVYGLPTIFQLLSLLALPRKEQGGRLKKHRQLYQCITSFLVIEMPVNWLEIGLQTAIIVALLASIGLYVRLKLIPSVLSKAEIWMGGAIGRFMANLAKRASEEEGAEGAGGGGALNIAGFKIDSGTIQSIAEILKVVQSLGFLKGGGGGEHPFMKK